MTTQGDRRLEVAMGLMLRIGVTLAAIVVLAGGVLYLVQPHASISGYRHFNGAPAADRSVEGILAGVAHLRSQSLIALGLLMLIATPVCRVLFGVVGFTLLKDRFYAAVSAVVLFVLLLSFVAGI